MVINKLFDHQKLALNQLKTGSILCGGVGSGKSLTALYYYYIKECGGFINDDIILPMKNPKNLFIITTAKKRDSLDWERESSIFLLEKISGVSFIVDSWNNIHKYINVENSFFIFDEQRVVGSGSWVKSFLKITKRNNWILLSATPGDTWLDYIPVFIANGFYKNRTEFKRKHVVYAPYSKFPKIIGYLNETFLEKLKKNIIVFMPHIKPAINNHIKIFVNYDFNYYKEVIKNRWNYEKNKPFSSIGEYLHFLRKIINCDPSRISEVNKIIEKHKRVIIFYNFDYELELLKTSLQVTFSEHNGHKHEEIPNSVSWAYLVQYLSGAEGWNCIESNTIIFYSLNYSYRIMTQAAGRIDRINTPFKNLYYYTLISKSKLDLSILKAIENKKDFNEKLFSSQEKHSI